MAIRAASTQVSPEPTAEAEAVEPGIDLRLVIWLTWAVVTIAWFIAN